MTIWGFYPSIWVYWVMHLGVLIVYGIFLLTRTYDEKGD